MPSRMIADAGIPPIALPSNKTLSGEERLEKGRFAGTVGADDGDGFARLEMAIDPEERLEVAVEGREPVCGEKRHGRVYAPMPI